MRPYFLLAAFLMPAVGVAQPIPGNFSPVTIVTTAGSASVTGTVSETNLANLKIPANSMGANGVIQVQCFWTYSNSANTKTFIIRYTNASGVTTGGVTGASQTATTTASSQGYLIIRNNNATNSQTMFATNPSSPFGANAQASPATLSLDTTQDTFVNVNAQLANTGETITLQHCIAEIYKN